MTERTLQRRRRTLPLLAQDGELQSLLEVPAAKIGQLIMLGDIILQSRGGSIAYKGGRKPARAIAPESGAGAEPTDYGQLKVHLRPEEWMLAMLSEDLWPAEAPPNYDVKYVEYLRACLYAAIHWHPGIAPALSGQEEGQAVATSIRPRTRAGKSRRSAAQRSRSTGTSSTPPSDHPDAEGPTRSGTASGEDVAQSEPKRRMPDLPEEYQFPEPTEENGFGPFPDDPVPPQTFAPDAVWEEMKAEEESRSARHQEQHSATSNVTDYDILPDGPATREPRESHPDSRQNPSDSSRPNPKTEVAIKNLKGIFE